jgi:HEPN domain-containing protein
MPPEPGSAADWLAHAQSDLALAEAEPPSGVLLELLCYHAQQAAEKALKSALIHLEQPFPYTHNIGRLVALVSEHIDVPERVGNAAALTPYATITRYPGDAVRIERGAWHGANSLARTVVEWAAMLIKHDNPEADS